MEFIALLSDPAAWLALLTLIALEVVLGVDHLIFIALLSNKLPDHQHQPGGVVQQTAVVLHHGWRHTQVVYSDDIT